MQRGGVLGRREESGCQEEESDELGRNYAIAPSPKLQRHVADMDAANQARVTGGRLSSHSRGPPEASPTRPTRGTRPPPPCAV